MKEIETGKDQIKKICSAIKTQTIEPAKQQAKEIIENAKLEAKQIIEAAEKQREEIFAKTEEEVERRKKLCASSIKYACIQVIDKLKQEIENRFFKSNLHELVKKASSDPDIIAKLITSIVKAIDREGIDVDLSAFIPKEISAEKINKLLLKDILDELQEKKVLEGAFSGGAKVKLHDKQITIDISDEALNDLIAEFIRKDFRDMIFGVKKR